MEPDQVLLARMLVVAYLLGTRKASPKDIPQTTDEMMSKGHDGLDWEAFMPLSADILKKVEKGK